MTPIAQKPLILRVFPAGKHQKIPVKKMMLARRDVLFYHLFIQCAQYRGGKPQAFG